jgi:hypothetical protein
MVYVDLRFNVGPMILVISMRPDALHTLGAGTLAYAR